MGDDKLSILERIERGELSVEEAEGVLNQVSEKDKNPTPRVERTEQEPERTGNEGAQPKESAAPAKSEMPPSQVKWMEDKRIPTRSERKLSLAEKLHNWEPQMMAGSPEADDSAWRWPWEDKQWQWMWQNFEYPIYMSHTIDITEGDELKVVSYQGDLFVRGWDKPVLKIDGAVFDIRISQEDNVIRVASSRGQLQIWVPETIGRIAIDVKPGDAWISSVSADVDALCQSGDVGCQHIKGNIRVRLSGGDTRLTGIEGEVDTEVVNGNCDVRDIQSSDVNLKVSNGDIWLGLDSVSSGRFQCKNEGGDINLLINGELSGELIAEATDGGRIAPVTLPWQKLLGRSEGKLHGIIKGEGAFINLATTGGKIYIQEPWDHSFSAPLLS